MSLYGYPREPEPTGDDQPDAHAPIPRVTSHPVAIPTPSSDSPAQPPAALLPPLPEGFAADPPPFLPSGQPPGFSATPPEFPRVPPESPAPGFAARSEFSPPEFAAPGFAAPEFVAPPELSGPSWAAFEQPDLSVPDPVAELPRRAGAAGLIPTQRTSLDTEPVPYASPEPNPQPAPSGLGAPLSFGPPPFATFGQPSGGTGPAVAEQPPGFAHSPRHGQPAVPVGGPVATFGQPPAPGGPPSVPFGQPPPSGTFGSAEQRGSEAGGYGPVAAGSGGIGSGAGSSAAGHPASGSVPASPRPTTSAISLPPDTIDAADDDPFDDAPSIPPWDRRPLLVVLASVAVLVLIGVVTGVVSAAMVGRNGPDAAWREPGTQPSPGTSPTELPGQGPVSPQTITLSGVGDVIMGAIGLGEPPNGGAGFFDPVKDALAADLVMGNLESALSDSTGYNKCGPPPHPYCFQFALPPSYANVLREGGFQVVTLANNHTLDMGDQGLVNTRAALDAAGVAHTGAVDQITYITVQDLRVAVLGFSVYSWGASLNDIPRAVGLVAQAQAEADLVVIQMQGGAEGSDKTIVPPAGQHEYFVEEDRGDLQGFARAVIDAGADVVFGHGPHVMRGMEFYNGRLIAYSLGNFCGYATLSSAGYSGVGGILKVTLHRDGTWSSGQLIATEMVNGGMVALDTEQRALSFVDGLSQQNFGATAARVDHSTGTITVPGA